MLSNTDDFAREKLAEKEYRTLVDGLLRSYGVVSAPGLADRMVLLFMTIRRNAELRGLLGRRDVELVE